MALIWAGIEPRVIDLDARAERERAVLCTCLRARTFHASGRCTTCRKDAK
jgi:hypothetical protein